MNVLCRSLLVSVLMVIVLSDAESACLQDEVEAHVREQLAIYGPRSVRHEYFGFIYLHDGIIGSAVTRSRACASSGKCAVDSNDAVQLIPRSATVMGEWHTHPHGGSPSLSADDVRGAYSNRHIRCYAAFYSTPSGEMYAWRASEISVPVAMASRTRLGNYVEERLVAGLR